MRHASFARSVRKTGEIGQNRERNGSNGPREKGEATFLSYVSLSPSLCFFLYSFDSEVVVELSSSERQQTSKGNSCSEIGATYFVCSFPFSRGSPLARRVRISSLKLASAGSSRQPQKNTVRRVNREHGVHPAWKTRGDQLFRQILASSLSFLFVPSNFKYNCFALFLSSRTMNVTYAASSISRSKSDSFETPEICPLFPVCRISQDFPRIFDELRLCNDTQNCGTRRAFDSSSRV